MAELLIYNNIHWMDGLTQNEIDIYSKKDENFQKKYDARYQKGDIVEVREDGFWDTRGFNKNVFCVIKIAGLENSNYLMEAYETVLDEIRSLIKRRKYTLAIETLNLGSEKKIEISETQMTNLLSNKAET